MTTEEAQQAQDILGMFLASSHPATVLFDSGASHSFISSLFVVKHHLPITIMKQTMLVSSPEGEMRTKHICPAISITIRGVDFLANLVQFNAAIQAKQVSLLNKAHGTSLNEIRIAQEYPDVFPEDLPGMLLDRNIEFIIELLPGTPLSLRGHTGSLSDFQKYFQKYP
jgi:hypothetical protein